MSHSCALSKSPLVLLLGLSLSLTPGAGAQKPEKATAAPAKRRPNIVFILTDDLDARLGTLAYMPNLKRLVAAEGLTLADYFVTNSLCCPSRATYLRGQYTHGHEVFTNRAPAGGYQKFVALGHENSTVATWLQSAGYRTALFGKYLNGYARPNHPEHVPPGWTEWYSPARGNAYGQYNYELNENGKLVPYGSRPADYMMDVLTRKALEFIRGSLAAGKPFFVYMAPYAPHGPSTPAPRHAQLFPELKAPRTPSFDAAPAVAAGPRRGRAPLTPQQIERIDAAYAQRIRSMQAVDEMIAALIDALRAAGQLDNTYIIFTSDNGFHMGQHRMLPGKSTAYEEDVSVPFVVGGPGVPRGETLRGVLAGNVDLAPTFAEWAGVAAPEFVEGRSLVPLLAAHRPAESAWRQAFLIEQYPAEPRPRPRRPGKRNVTAAEDVLEPDDPSDAQMDSSATYVALRTSRYKYIEHASGERELYDLTHDPDELQNLAPREPAWVRKFSAWVARLHACAGRACRAAESEPPE